MEEWNDVYDAQRRRTGRTHLRGTPWGSGEYGLTVCVWVYDGRGRLLLTRRAPEKSFAGTWENSGGMARAGEDSLTAIQREQRPGQEYLLRFLLPEKPRFPEKDPAPAGGDGRRYVGRVWEDPLDDPQRKDLPRHRPAVLPAGKGPAFSQYAQKKAYIFGWFEMRLDLRPER